MKERLNAIGVFSVIGFIVLLIIAFVIGGYPIGFSGAVGVIGALWIINVVGLVLGVITLAMEKHSQVKGLTIASGVLSILSFIGIPILIANAVVSLMAVYKINQTEEE